MATASVSLCVSVDSSKELWGGPYERSPYLAVWASWGRYRIPACHDLSSSPTVTLGPFELPSPDELRGDERVWLKQYALSDKSGIAAIDEKEEGHVARDIQAGALGVPLVILLRAASSSSGGGEALAVTLVDPILQNHLIMQARSASGGGGDEAMNALFDSATKRATKGTASIVPSVTGTITAHVRTLNQRYKQQNDPAAPLLFETPRMIDAMVRARDTIMTTYSIGFYAAPDGGLAEWPIGREQSLENLHLVSYVSDQGTIPAQYYVLNDAMSRPMAAGSDLGKHAAFYAVNGEGAQFMEQQLLASLTRNGMAKAQFLAAIKAQHARAKTDATVSNDYRKALRAIADVGTYVANTANYTSDVRYPNRSAMMADGHGAECGHPRMRRHHKRMRHRVLAAKHTGAAAAPATHDTAMLQWYHQQALIRAGAAPQAQTAAEDPAVPLESFDTGIITGTSNADDCEGDDMTANHVLDTIPQAAAASTPAEAPLVHAAAAVLDRFIITLAGASVTSKYVDTEGQTLTRKDLADLPRIGDEVDARSEIGGHAHGVVMSTAVVGDMLERGGAPLDKDLPALAKARVRAAAWERAVGVMVLEGTGSTDPWVLPSDEVLPGDGTTAKVRAAYAALREHYPTLVDAFKFDGLPYYDAVQPRDRRVSPFYRGVVALLAPRLHAMNPCYGSLVLVSMADHARGMDIGTLLRDAGAPGGGAAQLALVSPFAKSMGRARWDAEITPVAACVQNQMPLTAFARFLPPAAASLAAPRAPGLAPQAPVRATLAQALARANHVLSDSVLMAMGRPLPATLSLGDALDRHSMGQQQRPAAAPAAIAAESTATAVLYTQPWRLAEEGVAERVRTELLTLASVHGRRTVHNRPLSHCVDTIELHLLL